MIKEFRAFIMRGNVIDLAVGIIIGAAFSAIVNSLVNDIIMPPIGYILHGVDFSSLFIALDGKSYPSIDAAKTAGAATINYGLFINALINFVIVALAVFLLVKAVNAMLERFKKEEAAAPTAPAEPPVEERLIAAIDKLTNVMEQKS
ncbi:MAG TPA: large-conductance mechanosensitive channel protein MscL [Phototrophicaceae bacterium]|nr:large-conductance mechanosensitive channel protein MscL [Phototrophicaceae bacterium]